MEIAKDFATFHYIEGKQKRISANVMAGGIRIYEIVCQLISRAFATS